MQSVQAHIANLSFAEALALFPAAGVLHVYEEWPRFPQWARRFASAAYSDHDCIATHVRRSSSRSCLQSCYARSRRVRCCSYSSRRSLALEVFWNAWFHLGGTVLSGAYCPGAVTGLMLYLPLSAALLVVLGPREGFFTGRLILLALAVAATFHTIEVGHNVFKRW